MGVAVARTHLVLSVVAGLLLLAGCGADREAPARIEPAAAPLTKARPVALKAEEVAGLGRVVTDQAGHTLYPFTQDSKNPSLSMCFDDCERLWRPVMATGDVVLTGVERDLVSTVARPDGSTQMTVGGWPVYTYTRDVAPGQANGQGVRGTWFAVSPEGGKTGAPDPAAVKATTIPGFGPVLTDGNGRTLYLFTMDGKNPSRATCAGECAANWPPLLITTGKVVLSGVDRDLVGKVRRADGTRQVTVGGWPVHTFTGDKAPGQTSGHGASGVWFAIEPAGCRSTAPVTLPPQAQGPDGSTGY
jgi:predicted lipoprotein with Yx(FWY)xxD motif